MLTKEQVRARYFACYIGCNVKYPNIDKGYTVAMLTGVSRTDGLETTFKRKKNGCCGDYLSFVSNGNHNSDALHTQLLLRPLSAITDEDAVKVANILGFQQDRFGVESVIEIAKSFCFNLFEQPTNTSEYKVVLAIDTLRSMGYHTGNFMGYDPIAEGWAIVDDKNVQP